jgi:hypothetical protein
MEKIDLMRLKIAILKVADASPERLAKMLERGFDLLINVESVPTIVRALIDEGLKIESLRNTAVPNIGTTVDKLEALLKE